MKEINPLLHWWVSPKLPLEHIFVPQEKRPKDPNQLARMYFRKWVVHPVKRHLAHNYSSLLTRMGCEIIGITGSAGKTTAKEMIASVLSQRYKTVRSPANIDPVYNIPTTLLNTPLGTEKLVLEMGIEYPGEMDFYLWLAQPRTGVITTIYWTHTEFLGSLEKVAREKGKLVESIPRYGYVVLNADDGNVSSLAKSTKAKIIWYSTKGEAGIEGHNISYTKDLETNFTLKIGERQELVTLPFLGRHFVSLACAAAAVGDLSGVPIAQIRNALEEVEPQPHRMNPIIRDKGIIIIDDTYNANPLATNEALSVLGELGREGRKIFVFGEMKELGIYEEKGHREVGSFAAKTGVDVILSLGGLTSYTLSEATRQGIKESSTFLANDKDELIDKVRSSLKPGDIVLVKGSRSMEMETVVDAIK